MNEKWFVYIHIRDDTGKIFYVGIGKQKIANTYKIIHYRAYCRQGRNRIWKSITNKTNYQVKIILDEVSEEHAKKTEISLISKHGKIKNGGILSNITDGGDNIPKQNLTTVNDPKCSQKIYQYTICGKFVKEWESSNEINRILGFDNSVIRKSVKGKTKSPNISYGFQWFLEFMGARVASSDSGKTTLHKKVRIKRGNEKIVFQSRQECADYFKTKSSQVTNAINKNWKMRGYVVENFK